MNFKFAADRWVTANSNGARKGRAGREHRVAWLLTLISFFSLVQSVSAAEVTLACVGFRCEIHLKGPIVKGDADKVLALVRDPNRSNAIEALVLDSPGGEVEEAMRLAEVVRTALITTSNEGLFKNGKLVYDPDAEVSLCVSACALVWLAGPERNLIFGPHTKRALGLHRPYFSKELYASESPSQLSRRQAEAMRRVREFLTGEGMPANIVDAMMNRSSKEVYWVTYKDTEAIGKHPAWFEEVLIAKCNFDPSYKSRILNDERISMDEARRMMEKAVKKNDSVNECKRRLTWDAQLQMRGSSAPLNTPHSVVR